MSNLIDKLGMVLLYGGLIGFVIWKFPRFSWFVGYIILVLVSVYLLARLRQTKWWRS